LAIVAMKPANKANEPIAEASTGANAAEPVERRAGAKGNAHQQSTHWTQSQARESQALERIRQAIAVIHPRWEPYAGKPLVRFCAGGYDAARSSRCSVVRRAEDKPRTFAERLNRAEGHINERLAARGETWQLDAASRKQLGLPPPKTHLD